MELSLFLAKTIGICFVIFSISLTIAKSHFQLVLKDLINHPASVMLVGTLNIILGVLIVVSHNVWQADWTVLITIIGWLLLIRGIIWTAFPGFLVARITKISDSNKALYISAIVIFILGIILCYLGFM